MTLCQFLNRDERSHKNSTGSNVRLIGSSADAAMNIAPLDRFINRGSR